MGDTLNCEKTVQVNRLVGEDAFAGNTNNIVLGA
jgi:hypothetical protein